MKTVGDNQSIIAKKKNASWLQIEPFRGEEEKKHPA